MPLVIDQVKTYLNLQVDETTRIKEAHNGDRYNLEDLAEQQRVNKINYKKKIINMKAVWGFTSVHLIS